MKRAMLIVLLTMLLMSSGHAWGQKTRFGQATYVSVLVQVQSSRLVNRCEPAGQGIACGYTQDLVAVVEGKKLMLEADDFGKALLQPGEYHGRRADVQPSKAYESECTIELQFPDGKSRWYLVVGETQ